MDGVARLEDGCPQVPGATFYQDIVLFIVVLQGSSATTLSPSDLSVIQPAHEGTASTQSNTNTPIQIPIILIDGFQSWISD